MILLGYISHLTALDLFFEIKDVSIQYTDPDIHLFQVTFLVILNTSYLSLAAGVLGDRVRRDFHSVLCVLYYILPIQK